MKAGNGAQRSDRIVRRVDPVAPLRYAPGFHFLLEIFRRGSKVHHERFSVYQLIARSKPSSK